MKLMGALMILVSMAATSKLQAEQIIIEQEMKPPVLIKKTEPVYTEEARKAKVEGVVVLRANIGTDGKPHEISVTKGLGYGLDESAIECLNQWSYRPGTADGHPIMVPATIEIFFRLNSK